MSTKGFEALFAEPAGSALPRVPLYREVRGVLFEARFCEKPAWFGSRREASDKPTPRQKLGRRYEKRALSALEAQVESGELGRAMMRIHPFVRYRDAVGVAYAEPDALIVGVASAAPPLLLECKLTYDEAHWRQVALYERLVRHIMHVDQVRSLLVVKTLRGRPLAPLCASLGAFAALDAPRGVLHLS